MTVQVANNLSNTRQHVLFAPSPASLHGYVVRCQVINLISFWSLDGRRPVHAVRAQASVVGVVVVLILSSVNTCDYAWCVCQFPHFPVPGGCHD